MNKVLKAKRTTSGAKTSAASAQTERNERGQFVAGSRAAQSAGKKGGILSSGKFVKGSERARKAGSKGGSVPKPKSSSSKAA